MIAKGLPGNMVGKSCDGCPVVVCRTDFAGRRTVVWNVVWNLVLFGWLLSSPSLGLAADGAKGKSEVVEITFAEISMNMTADMVFRPFLVTDRVRELEGKRVRITGKMFNLGASAKTDNFVLLKNKECKFGPGGQADHLVNIVMRDGTKVKYREEPLTVEGIFKLNPTGGVDGNTWSVFDLIEATAR